MTTTPTHPKETPMTVTATAPATTTPVNPYTIPAKVTGWAVIIVFLGALWGAGNDPENAAWSAFAVVAMIACYLYNKIRQAAFAARTKRNAR